MHCHGGKKLFAFGVIIGFLALPAIAGHSGGRRGGPPKGGCGDKPDCVDIEFEFIDGDAIGKTAVEYYDYWNYSAHTGLERNDKSIMFFYQYAGELNLFVIHNEASDGGYGEAAMKVSGLTDGWEVALYDDPESTSSDNYSEGSDWVKGDWSWYNTTDGMVVNLGTLEDIAGTTITIDPTVGRWRSVYKWYLLGSDGEKLDKLDLGREVCVTFPTPPTTPNVPAPTSTVGGLLGLCGLGVMRLRGRQR